MKKSFKLGFTLAEILVTLSIVGIISALVLPTIATNSQNKKHAIALGRSVETIESGCQMLIQRANEGPNEGIIEHSIIELGDIISSSSSTTSVTENNNLFVNAAEFFNVVPLSSSEASSYQNLVHSYNGGTPSPTVGSIATNFAKNPGLGAYYGVLNVTEANSTDPIREYIYIDTNGPSSPNRYGIDIFLFGLTDRCYMIPAGSQRMHTLNSSIPTEANGCNGAGNSVTNGLSCTSRVIKDGYKNEYKR